MRIFKSFVIRRFNRLLHKIGCLVVENIESFCSYKAHDALKRLQIEANAGCDELKIWRHGKVELLRIPNSLSFESMDEGEYQEVAKRYAITCILNIGLQ